jgi:hypothetical protein
LLITIGIFYTLTSLAGYPSVTSAMKSAQGPGQLLLRPSTQYASHWVTSVMSYLIITGSFACGMAFHNATARYAYSLGREGMMLTQGYVVYLLFKNIGFLGAGYGYAKLFGPIDAAVVVIGIGLAFYYKKFKPETFDKVGRLINEGL